MLARRVGDEPDLVASWAGHLLRAGGEREVLIAASAAAVQAARQAGRRLAFEDEARWWRAAADAAERAGAPADQRIDLLLELATSEYRAGDFTGCLADCERVVAVAGDHGLPERIAAAALVMQGLGSPDVCRAVLHWCDMALDTEQLADPVLRSRLLAQKSSVLAEMSRMPEAGETSLAALVLARASADPIALLDAARARSALLTGPGDVAERLELGAMIVREATTAGRPLEAVWGHFTRCDAAYMLGNLDAVDAETEAIGRLAESNRLPLARWFHLRLRASRAMLEGRFDDGLLTSSQALELARRMGDRSAAGLSYAYLLSVAVIRGTPELLTTESGQVLMAAPRIPVVQVSAAVAELVKGNRDAAREGFEQVRLILRRPQTDGRWYGAVAMLTELTVAFGDAESARLATEVLQPWGAYSGGMGTSTVINVGSIQRTLGRLAAVEGRLEDAEKLLTQAIEGNIRLGARPYVVLSRLELAELINRRDGSPPEPRLARALELAGRAGAEARRLGMPGPQAKAEALITTLQGADRNGRRDPGPLTAREQEIAALVARALSNREVADRLVLSERTVESHVRNILAKLGFSTRTEIATWSIKQTP